MLVSVLFSLQAQAQTIQKLNIPGRLQWDNSNGYCGELSIQSIGLYYGNYISQDVCRKLAGGEVLFGNLNGETVIDKLSFTSDSWNFNQSGTHYQNYLVWVKQHLNNSHPVIITVYVDGESNADYDHIIPAIGFKSKSASLFDDADELMFYDNYDSNLYTRTFQSMWDSRSMKGNGASNLYCIPKEVDYGTAITGIKDINHITKPVHLSISRWDEPNITLGEMPTQLTANIEIDSLTVGEKYTLLRYNNYASVPSTSFDPAGASSAIYFTAANAKKYISDKFMSDASVFYRCVPFEYNSIHNRPNSRGNSYRIFPNPTSAFLTIELDQKSQIEILNIQGQVLQNIKNTASSITLDISYFPKGTYFLQVTNHSQTIVEKLVIQ